MLERLGPPGDVVDAEQPTAVSIGLAVFMTDLLGLRLRVAERLRELRRYVLAAEERAAPDPRRQAEQGCLAYLQFAAELPGYYRVLFHTRTRPSPSQDGHTPPTAEEVDWPQSAAEAFGDLVRAVKRCLPPERDPFQAALMVWAGLHGYVMLRESLGHFPFPDRAEYVTRLLDAHLTA